MFQKNKSRPSSVPATQNGKKDGFPSIITADMHILGNIVSEGVIDFSGTLDGNIRCGTLTIRQNGNVKGEVTADSVYIYGKLNGLIRAKHVHLFSTCHIEGIIMHESITIEDGAFVDGKCKRTDKVDTSAMPEEAFEDDQPTVKLLDNIRLIR